MQKPNQDHLHGLWLLNTDQHIIILPMDESMLREVYLKWNECDIIYDLIAFEAIQL